MDVSMGGGARFTLTGGDWVSFTANVLLNRSDSFYDTIYMVNSATLILLLLRGSY